MRSPCCSALSFSVLIFHHIMILLIRSNQRVIHLTLSKEVCWLSNCVWGSAFIAVTVVNIFIRVFAGGSEGQVRGCSFWKFGTKCFAKIMGSLAKLQYGQTHFKNKACKTHVLSTVLNISDLCVGPSAPTSGTFNFRVVFYR